MRSSIIGVVVLGVLSSGCGDKAEAPPPKTPEVTAVASSDTTPPPPPPPVDTPPPLPAPKPPLAELEQEATQTLVDGMNTHDARKVGSLYASDAIFRAAGATTDITGRDAITANAQSLFDTFSNLKFAIQLALVKNDVVTLVWQATGTHSGTFLGLAATEKPVGFTAASVLWFNADGQIKEEHAYWDAGTVVAQITAGPKGGRVRPVPALAPQPVMFVATGSDTEQKNADALKAWYGAFEQKTADAFLAPLTDDVEWDELAGPAGAMKGKAIAKKYFGDLKAGFPDLRVQLANAWAVGDFVVAENVMTGTQKGAFMGKPASKKALNLHGVDVAQLKGGMVVKGWSFANGGEMGAQLGWVKAPAAPAAKTASSTGTAKPAPATTGAKR